MAAFTMCTNGGLIPQARQGGIAVFALAVAGSKLEGTGFENEHIGQIQVAFAGGGAGETAEERSGLPCRTGVADVELLCVP